MYEKVNPPLLANQEKRLTHSVSLDWELCQKVRLQPLAHPYKKCCSGEVPRPCSRKAEHPADLPVMVDKEESTFYNIKILYPVALRSIGMGYL